MGNSPWSDEFGGPPWRGNGGQPPRTPAADPAGSQSSAPPRSAPNGSAAGPSRDEVTRLLSARAHLSADFCTLAIREFLSEPRRAIAPSPGVDAAAVLREALSARVRRRWRDGALAVLFVVFAIVDLPLLAIWVGAAAVWNLLGPRRRRLDQRRRPRMGKPGAWLAFGVFLFVGFLGALTAVRSVASDPFGTGEGSDVTGLTGSLPTAILLGLAMAAVLVADRLLVWSLLTRRFRRRRFEPHPTVPTGPRSWGSSGTLGRQLNRLHADPFGNVVVYVGDKPFIGSGEPGRTARITLPLVPDEGDGRHQQPTVRFGALELYDHIGASVRELRDSSPTLSPSHRLGGLTEFGTVVVPANDLVRHAGDANANLILPDPARAPVSRIEANLVRQIADRPLEWIRYYRCFQVEGWERDLVVSVFLHIGADEDMLYFELTPCVLAPISRMSLGIDALSGDAPVAPLLDALGSLVALPTSIVVRLIHAFAPLRAPGQGSKTLYASRYGARFSLRELAVEDEVTDYLKGSDAVRYVSLMQERIFKSTAEFLRSRGLSSSMFEEKVRMYQNYDVRGAVFNGPAFGQTNIQTNTTAPAGPAHSGLAAGG